MTTLYYSVSDSLPTHLPPESWTPWKVNPNDDIELTRRLVINRFIRDRGGIDGLNTLFLFEHGPDAPRHANGNLSQVTRIEYSIAPAKEQ